MDNILSQDELDALLNDVIGSEDESNNYYFAVESNEEKNLKAEKIKFSNNVEGEVNRLNFENQERIIRAQFPVLEKIHDRMVRKLTDELFLLFSREIKLEQEQFSIIKCKEFLATLNSPLLINVFRFNPLRSKGLIIFNGSAIFEIVENYFGGHSQGSELVNEEREMTTTEIKIVNRVMDKIVDKLEGAWAPIKPLKIEYVRTETSIPMMNLYSKNDLLICTRFKFSFGSSSSFFYIVMPYLMVEPIREQLEVAASKRDEGYDSNWVNALKNELLNVELTLTAELANKIIKLSEVDNLKIGDFIPLEISETVPMSIENHPLFMVKVGTANEKCSVQIVNEIEY